MSHIPICTVRIIVNHTLSDRYTFHINADTQDLDLCIQVKSPIVLDTVVKQISDNIRIKHRYRVIFNFKSAPVCVRNNTKFRHLIQKMFQVPAGVVTGTETQDLTTMAECIQNHVSVYGHCPKFNIRTPKNLERIQNYISSVLNNNISQDTATQIADILTESP
jgi:hypothetical protein